MSYDHRADLTKPITPNCIVYINLNHKFSLMGQGTSAYDQSELAEFQDLTYFTKREVLQ